MIEPLLIATAGFTAIIVGGATLVAGYDWLERRAVGRSGTPRRRERPQRTRVRRTPVRPIRVATRRRNDRPNGRERVVHPT